MVSSRLKLLASFIEKEDRVIDVGCDHALLPIYLVKNNICTLADGSDIKKSIIDNALLNVKKYKLERQINLFVSDGLNNIDLSKYNTVVIAGMGFLTIKKILDYNIPSNIEKLILQTNNNHEFLRRYLLKKRFYITKEVAIKDKNINYLLFVVSRNKNKISNSEMLCGLYNKDNIWFYKEELSKNQEILNLIPKSKFMLRSKYKKKIKIYNKYISERK